MQHNKTTSEIARRLMLCIWRGIDEEEPMYTTIHCAIQSIIVNVVRVPVSPHIRLIHCNQLYVCVCALVCACESSRNESVCVYARERAM